MASATLSPPGAGEPPISRQAAAQDERLHPVAGRFGCRAVAEQSSGALHVAASDGATALRDLPRVDESRAFKVSFGEPPHGYIVRRRIEEAKRIMEETEEPLSQIAAACGFADQSHFCRHFRRSECTSPSLWRRARAMDPGLAAAE